LRQALAREPDAAFQLALDELLQRVRQQDAMPWFQRVPAGADELGLEPLAGHHATALLAQFRDRQIAAQTMLPVLATLAETDAWISAQAAQPGRMSCAVMHREWGLVGVVSLHARGDAGLFYFWIGSDFRGRGYGLAAATALLTMAQDHAGLREFFAVSGNANAAAIGALAQIGFRALDAAMKTSSGAFGFHYIGDEVDDRAVQPRLTALCQAAGLPLVAT
jgi:RimJ/RimL family protein N-acetyltransferase